MIISEDRIKLALEKKPETFLLAMMIAAISIGMLKKGVRWIPESTDVHRGLPIMLNI